MIVDNGVRRAPFGIRTKLSSDSRLITFYYFTTAENPEQHIAASIWEPNL